MDEIYRLSEDGKVFEMLLDSSLKEFTIPEGVTSIGDSAFSYCSSLESIVIPDGVTEICYSAFEGCSGLESIVIPSGVTKIGCCAFFGCDSLQRIVVDPNNKVYDSRNNCNAIIETSSNTLISGCKTTIIPDGVTEIGDCAFAGCTSLESIVIPEGVNGIGNCAFDSCSSLQSIDIPSGVTVIGSSAFEDCSSLESIVIPKGVNEIGDCAFECCSSLKSIIIPDGVKEIDEYVFNGCSSLESIVIPEGVNKIGDSAFACCTSLESIVLPEGVDVEEIGEDAFYGCKCFVLIDSGKTFYSHLDVNVIDFSIPSGVTRIYSSAFDYCSSLESIVIPDGVTSIGESAFAHCSSLESIIIPKGVKEIGGCAFDGCTSLKTIVIPKGVKEIGEYAFSGCSSLESIVLPEGVLPEGVDVEEIDEAFYGCKCFVLTDSGKTFYRHLDKNVIDFSIPSGVTLIHYSAFEDCSSLKSIIIPDGVKDISHCAFLNCTSLESIVIPDGVEGIDDAAFAGCENLHTVVLPEGLDFIGDSVFAGCSSLRNMVVPKSVKHIGDKAFDGCDNFDPYPYSIVFTYKSKGKDLEVRSELTKFEINNDIDLSGALKGKQLIKDNDGEVLMSIYDRYDHYITKDLLLDRNLDIIANEDCSHTLYFEDVEVGFYMICGIDDETLGAELEAYFKQRDKYKFLKLFNPYDYEFHEVLAGYDCGFRDYELKYSIYDENEKCIKRGSKLVYPTNIIKYTPNYPGDECFKEVNTKYIVRCYDAYEIGMVPYPVPKDFNMDNIHFNDGRAFHSDNDDRIDLTQIHYKGKVYEAVMDDIGDNGTYGAREYELYKKDENGRYELLGTIW